MKKLIIFIALVLGHSLNAQNSTSGSWYLGENVAATFPNISDNHSVGTGDGWPNDLYVNHDASTSGAISFLGGYTWSNDNAWLPFYSLSVSYTYAFPVKVNGTLFQYSLPQFENYSYRYEIQRQTFLGIVKTNIFRYRQMMPFLLFGLGFSANHVDYYQEQAMPGVFPRHSPDFQSETTTHFSYAVGAGLDYMARNNLWVGLGYNFGYFGHAQTGPGISSYSTERLRTKLTENSVVLSISYFLDKTA